MNVDEGVTESDRLLFNPCEDELNQQWVFDTLIKNKGENQSDNENSADSSDVTAQINRVMERAEQHQQLSCANCFTPLAFTLENNQGVEKERVARLKERFKSKYVVKASNGVQTENVLLDQSKVIQIQGDKEQTEEDEEFTMFFFKGMCRFCMAHVAIFDPEGKTYYFVGVVPNYIG